MTKEPLILAINPGSTSTRLGLYKGEKQVFERKVEHSAEELVKYKLIVDQLSMRKEAVLCLLTEEGIALKEISAVAGRGGQLPPLKQGAYAVNKDMVEFLTYRPVDQHPSSLGALIGDAIAAPLGIPAYIYDGVMVDQMEDIARLAGVPQIRRKSAGHMLNMRAVALKTAKKLGKKLENMQMVVCHMGGGISASVFKGGRMIDIVSDEEGPYSPERAGGVPCRQLVNLCFSGKFDKATLIKLMRGRGGLIAYLGTNNARDVEKMIADGDEQSRLIYEGIAYQTAKGIAGLVTVVHGKVDCIVLTGALVHSKMLMDWLIPRISFLAPVELFPGEDELEALAHGILRVLRGEEGINEFIAPPA